MIPAAVWDYSLAKISLKSRVENYGWKAKKGVKSPFIIRD